jgi:hypothetical protein
MSLKDATVVPGTLEAKETINQEGKCYEAEHRSYPDHPRRQAYRL